MDKTHIQIENFRHLAYCGRSMDEEHLLFVPPDEATCKTCKTCQRCYALTQELPKNV